MRKIKLGWAETRELTENAMRDGQDLAGLEVCIMLCWRKSDSVMTKINYIGRITALKVLFISMRTK